MERWLMIWTWISTGNPKNRGRKVSHLKIVNISRELREVLT